MDITEIVFIIRCVINDDLRITSCYFLVYEVRDLHNLALVSWLYLVSSLTDAYGLQKAKELKIQFSCTIMRKKWHQYSSQQHTSPRLIAFTECFSLA